MPRPADMPALRGLPNPNTTPLPNCLVDEYLPYFTGAELKVILYLVRRTLGFHKTRDAISLSQICGGIVRKDGRRLDWGTGLHKSTACDALNSLIAWGMIKRVTRRDPARGDLPTEYILWIDGEGDEIPGDPAEDDAPRNPGPGHGGADGRRARGARRASASVTVVPVSGTSDTPLSGGPDTPVSAISDAPVSVPPDIQPRGLQKKTKTDPSNIRKASPDHVIREERPPASTGMAATGCAATPAATPPREFAAKGVRADASACNDPAREALHRFAEVAAREFNDAAPFGATLSRLINLHRRSGLSTAEFADRFDAARQRTKERTGAIRLPAAKGTDGSFAGKNKMPYFFALLEDLLGLRSAPDDPVPGAHEVPTTPADDRLPAVPDTQPRQPIVPSLDRSPVGRSPATRVPESVDAPAGDDDDARLIGEVVREFSRQFASYDAAVALGDWAIARWRGSGLSRGRFLEVAQVAADGLLRDRAAAASAPGFRARLQAALVESGDLRVSLPRDSSSPRAGQRAAPWGEGSGAARLAPAAGRVG
jgi:hypothetical protein